jgi:hypothetical protein
MPGKHALIIGNSQYEDPTLPKLKTPGADVRGLAELLRDGAIGQFESVRTVIDESEAITRRAIAAFFAQGKPDELLLLYFSGHGVLDDKGRLYLAAKDTQRDLPQATAIPAAFITDGMDSSRSRRQVLILDCCHSGAFARGARSATGAKAITETTFEGVGYGRAVLTATDATQYAWEGEAVIGSAENSVFTHHMIEGLRSGAADTDGDGDVTLEELYDYIYSRVVKQTPKQTPRKWSYNQEGEFIIARNPKPPAPKVTPLPLELQQSIDDPRTWVREGAVAELSRLLSGGQPGLSAAAYTALQRLTGDDSRRVAEAASKTLAAWTGEATHQHPPAERTKDSAQRAAQAEAETMAQREAAQRAAAEEAARLERERAANEAAAQMVSERVVLTPPAREAAATRQAASNPFAVWMDKPWFPLAVLTVGWALASFIGTLTFWFMYMNNDVGASRFAELLALGLIGGAATWLSLRAARLQDRESPPALIIGLMVAIMLAGVWLYPYLQENGVGIDESIAWERAILGTLGGIAMGAVLYRARRVDVQRAALIAVGWAIGWSVAAWLGLTVYNFFGDDPSSGIKEALQPVMADDLAHALVPWVDALIRGLTGALAGLISGWVTFEQLREQLPPVPGNKFPG